MRTITKNFKKRLEAQSKEAKILGLTKLASELDTQVEINKDRDNDSFYLYAFEELEQDVYKKAWDAAIRIQDFYGKLGDAKEVDQVVKAFTTDLIDSIRNKTGSLIGAYEPNVPGEEAREQTAIEVGE